MELFSGTYDWIINPKNSKFATHLRIDVLIFSFILQISMSYK